MKEEFKKELNLYRDIIQALLKNNTNQSNERKLSVCYN